MAKQVQKRRPREGQPPERGVVEASPADDDARGRPARLQTLRLAAGAEDFARRLERPRAFGCEAGAALAELCDLAWLLASCARDGLARVEATRAMAPAGMRANARPGAPGAS